MLLINDIGLIGDFLGTIPAMIALSTLTKKLTVVPHHEIYEIFDMIPKYYNITRLPEAGYKDNEVCQFNLPGAFAYAVQNNLHMTQAHHRYVDLPTPPAPIRPELIVPKLDVPQYDYILAPFSRSLPASQKWPRYNWLQLVHKMPDKSFAVFGNSKYDPIDFIHGSNVTAEFDRPFKEVVNIMRTSKAAITVVSGISHFAFALGTKNILLANQGMRWGLNPEAVLMTKPILTITVNEVIEKM